MRKLFAVLVSLICIFPVSWGNERDSVYRKPSENEQFHVKQLLLPASLMTVGAIGVNNPWFEREINYKIRDWAASIRQDQYIRLDDYTQYLPLGTFLLLGTVRSCDHPFWERTLTLANSYLFVGIAVNSLKYAVADLRPDGASRNSFPSGHTATAFMGAELVRREYGPWWGTGAYLVATGTAFLRIYNNRHWLSDVLAGMAIGILCADIGYWLLPYERDWLTKGQSLSLVPCVPVGGNSIGCGLAYSVTF